MIIALVALAFGSVVAFEATKVRVIHGPTGYPTIAPVPSGPIWLQGRLFFSWWGVAALLLIVCAVAAALRSLALINRGAEYGLASTVGALLFSSATLMAGNALLLGVLGLVASFVVYGRFSGARFQAGGSPTNSTSFLGFQLASKSSAVWQRPRGWARTMAIIALGLALLPIPLTFVSYAHFLAGLPLSFVALVLGIGARLRIRATGEVGQDWAVGAIVVSSVFFGLIACVIFLNWVVSLMFATS